MFKDSSGLLSQSDGKYDSSIQKQLLQLSIDYNTARFDDDKEGMEAAHKAAEKLRAKNLERVFTDTDAAEFNLHLETAYIAADVTGLKKDSFEYGLFITAYMVDASATIDEINKKAENRMMSATLVSIIKVADKQCFTEETLIKTSDGYKKIKDIKIGDKVYSENVETGEKEYKSVKQLFINKTYSLVNIKVKDIVLNTTENHPLYVINKGWINASNLEVGDNLKLADGSTLVVEEIELKVFESPIDVYNFEVEDWHTYFVSEFDIFVHNDCWGNNKTLEDHFKRHGTDFDARTAEDYAKKANEFYKNRGNYEMKVDSHGITRVYDAKTNTFGSYNPDGTTRTFYKSTNGKAYFDRQPGK